MNDENEGEETSRQEIENPEIFVNDENEAEPDRPSRSSSPWPQPTG